MIKYQELRNQNYEYRAKRAVILNLIFMIGNQILIVVLKQGFI